MNRERKRKRMMRGRERERESNRDEMIERGTDADIDGK